MTELAAALATGRLDDGGRIMDASHASLRDDFESSTPSIDRLCDKSRSVPGVFGARITGGGWGGAVVALARPGSARRSRLACAGRRRGDRRAHRLALISGR